MGEGGENIHSSAHKYYIPLRISYIASSLRKAGYEVRLIDATLEKNLDKKLEEIKGSEIIGIGLSTINFSFVEETLSRIREINPNARIIIGGALANSTPELIVRNLDLDYLVYGEGERTIVELADSVRKKQDIERVKGIYFKDKNGKIHFTGQRERIQNLDEIPFPAFDLFDLKTYLGEEARPLGVLTKVTKEDMWPYLSIMTHRGCPYKCTFCQIPKMWPRLSFRSIDNVVEELKWQKSSFGVKGCYIRDDNLGPTEERIRDLCDALIEEEVNLKYLALIRATTLSKLKPETLKLMRKAGFRDLRIGIESGSDKILEAGKKGISVWDIENAVKKARDFGFLLDGSFIMLGHPQETEETLEETEKLVTKLGVKVRLCFAIPLPGTPWYDYAKSLGYFQTEKQEIKFLKDLKDWDERPIINISRVSDDKLIDAYNRLLNLNMR